MVVGLLLMLVIPIAARFLKRDPAQMGLLPLGSEEVIHRSPSTMPTGGLLFSDAVRTKQLWLLLMTYAGFGFTIHSVMVHVVVHAIGLGLPPASAAAVMIAIGGVGVVGRVGIGSLADRLGAKRLLVIQFGLLALSLFWLATIKDAWTIYPFALAFGFAFGGIVPLHSHIVAHLFGLRSHGAILGTIGCSIGIGSAIGPVLTGYCYDLLGSYVVPFAFCGGVAAACALLTLLVRPLAATPPARHSS